MKKRRGRLVWNDGNDSVQWVDDEKGEWLLAYDPYDNGRSSKGCMYYAVAFVLLVVLLIMI
jgi:hypothetical protein